MFVSSKKNSCTEAGFVAGPILYTVVGLVLALGVGAFLFNAYISSVNEGVISEEDVPPAISVDSESVERLTSSMGAQGRDSTQEGLNNVVSEIDAQLNESGLADDARKKLLLSKAMMLGTVRSLGIQTDGVTEAANILNSVFASELTNTNDDKYKFAAIPLYYSMLHATCYYSGLAEALPAPYNEYYQSLMDVEKLPLKQSVLLAFDNFADQGNDPRFARDTAMTSHRAFLLALYFYAYGSGTAPAELDQAEREALLWNKLNVLLGTDTQVILLTGPNRSEIDPALRFAFAYDIANTYGKDELTPEVNQAIDARYEAVYATIDKNVSINDDTSTAVGRILNSIFYLESMHRRYSPDELNTQRVNEIIQIFTDNVSLNVDTRELYSGYFLEGITEDGKWMPVRTKFIELAADYPVLVQFFSDSFGIDL